MAFSKIQRAKVKNHIPTVGVNCTVFLKVFDASMGNKDEDKAKFLIALVDFMEKDLKEVKEILESQI